MRKYIITTAFALASIFAAQQAVAKTPKTATSKHHKKHMKKSAASHAHMPS